MTRRWCRNVHKRYNKTQGTTRLRTRQNYRVHVGRVSRQEQKLPCRCFLPTSPWRLIWIEKLDTIPSAITTTWNKTIVIAGDTNIDYNKPSAVLELLYKEVLDTYKKQHVKKPTRQGVKTIDYIVSNLEISLRKK